MNLVAQLLPPLLAALLVAIHAEPAQSQPVEVGSNVPLADQCNAPEVHCVLAAKGITVEGAGLTKVKHYAEGNSVWMHGSKPGDGTAHGCGGSVTHWKFAGSLSRYDGGNASSNPHMKGFFFQYPDRVYKNGGGQLVDHLDADIGLLCDS